jgi:hypothetical protein
MRKSSTASNAQLNDKSEKGKVLLNITACIIDRTKSSLHRHSIQKVKARKIITTISSKIYYLSIDICWFFAAREPEPVMYGNTAKCKILALHSTHFHYHYFY